MHHFSEVGRVIDSIASALDSSPVSARGGTPDSADVEASASTAGGAPDSATEGAALM